MNSFSDAKALAILDQLQACIFVTDPALSILYCNAASEELLRLSSRQIVGMGLKEVFLDGVEKTEAEYRILGSMKEKVNIQFLAWIRFIVYDGDLDDLYNTVSENMEKAKQ